MERRVKIGVALSADGEMEVDLSEDFRRNAATCLSKAREARTVEAQAEWLDMADFWFRLALQSEGRNAPFGPAAQDASPKPQR